MEFKLVAKVFFSVILLGAILIICGLMVALGPLYLALAIKGKASTSALFEIVPLAALTALLWRLWAPVPANTPARRLRSFSLDLPNMSGRKGTATRPSNQSDDIPY